MEVHRRQLHRRQGRTTSTTPTQVSTIGKPTSTKSPSPSTTTSKPPTSTTSSTSSTPSSTSSSTSSPSSSSSSSSTSTSVTSIIPISTTSRTSVTSSPKTSLPATSFTRSSLTSPTPKPSSTGDSDSNNSGTTVSTGAVVGGIAAGILGIAGIIFAVLYFIRRLKKRKDHDAFDSDVFRRQSRMLHDEPLALADDHSPFAPRPPTMIERRMNSTPVSNMGGNNYGPGPAYGGHSDYSTGHNHPGFAPGMVFPHHPYAEPRLPGSPTSPPTSPPMSVNHADVGVEQSQSAYLSRQPSTNGPTPMDNGANYVDLSRSSVTPFQAAQYEEIHRRLNIPPPAPVLGSLAEEEYPQNSPIPMGPSPFADPSEDVLPPPSPVHSNRTRVDSNPPRLPELNPPMSPVYALRPVTAEVPSKQTEPSPADLPAVPAPAHVTRPNPSTPHQKRPDTVYTIYDDEDAYAGI